MNEKRTNNKTRELVAAAYYVGRYLRYGKARAITMRSLANQMYCSKGAAERRFDFYVEKYLPGGAKRLKSCPVREGERGPESVGFYL